MPAVNANSDDLFMEFLTSSASQVPFDAQFGGATTAAAGAPPSVQSGAGLADVGQLEPTEQKKATMESILALYGPTASPNQYGMQPMQNGTYLKIVFSSRFNYFLAIN